MVFSIRFSKSLSSGFCARQLLRDEISDLAIPFHQQTRGKTKKASQSGFNYVQLLQDVTGYGPIDSVIAVERGRMRNFLYPRNMARYVLADRVRELKQMGTSLQRDSNFGVKSSKDEPTSELPTDENNSVPDMRAQLLTPERATDILSEILPSSLIFYRVPIPQPSSEAPVPPEPPIPFRQLHPSIADMKAAKAPAMIDYQAIPIYGSVTTADIAESVKAWLAETEEGARVVLGADEVKIIRTEMETDAESDRLKTLGEFQVAIQVKGGGAVARTVNIQAGESKIRRITTSMEHRPDGEYLERAEWH